MFRALAIVLAVAMCPIANAGLFDGIFGGRRGGWFGRSGNSFDSVPLSARPKAEIEPDLMFNESDMFNPEDWKVKYFDVVVVVNKAIDGQTARVYRKGQPAMNVRVSTGRETPEYSATDRDRWGLPYAGHMPKRSYFSQTRTGYFTPEQLDIDHVSGQWTEGEGEGTPMPYSVLFYSGVATHQGAEPNKLGRRASGGCVRMTRPDAQKLFWMVRMSGGPLTPDEMATPMFMREMNTFVAAYGQPYAEPVQTPVFDRNTGQLQTDPTTGEVVMQPALAKTLFVVENYSPGFPPVADNDGIWNGDTDTGMAPEPEPVRTPTKPSRPTCRSAGGFPVPCP